MKAPAHYFTLRDACRPLIQHYHADLLKHDRRALREYPTLPFFHITRSHGTHLILLRPADAYPKAGERVPYLFGTATRAEILARNLDVLQYCARNHAGDTVHYFDGKRLAIITYARAADLMVEYLRAIKAAWLGIRNPAAIAA